VPLGLSVEKQMSVSEISRTEALVANLAHERRFFRPFGGGGILDRRLLNREALDHLVRESYTCVLWNVVPEDWARPTTWVERALTQCFEKKQAVLVLHDLPTGAMSGLDRFLSEAKDRGATFVQDFPQDCVPIERGKVTQAIDAYVTEEAAAA